MKFKIELIASLSGWLVSLAIHLLALFSTVGLVLFVAPEKSNERKVGIYVENLDQQIKTTTDDLPSFTNDNRLVDLIEVSSDPSLQVAPMIASLTGNSGNSTKLQPDINTQSILIDENMQWDGLAVAEGGTAGDAASFFGIQAAGGKFVFVIDKSGSMNADEKLILAKAEVTRSISALSSWQEFFVIFYSDKYLPMPAEHLVHATPELLKKYIHWMEDVGPSGGTDPTIALRLALALRPDVIYLLSDGIFPTAVVDAVEKANPNNRTTIHTIAYYSPSGEELLRKISSANGGKHIYVQPPKK